MANIGTFKKSGDTNYTGEIVTMSLQKKNVTIVAISAAYEDDRKLGIEADHCFGNQRQTTSAAPSTSKFASGRNGDLALAVIAHPDGFQNGRCPHRSDGILNFDFRTRDSKWLRRRPMPWNMSAFLLPSFSQVPMDPCSTKSHLACIIAGTGRLKALKRASLKTISVQYAIYPLVARRR